MTDKNTLGKPIPATFDDDGQPYRIERGDKAMPCSCGGWCDLVDCTKAEIKMYDCGWGCCSVAFVCRVCGTRYAGTQPAPEMY